MCLALAVGRGNTPFANLGGDESLAHAADVVLLGRRDHAEPWYGHDALRASAMHDIPRAAVRERGMADTSRAALHEALCIAEAEGAATELLDVRALNLPMFVPDLPIPRMAFFDTYRTLGVATEILILARRSSSVINMIRKIPQASPRMKSPV
jgi:hypothetical protein